MFFKRIFPLLQFKSILLTTVLKLDFYTKSKFCQGLLIYFSRHFLKTCYLSVSPDFLNARIDVLLKWAKKSYNKQLIGTIRLYFILLWNIFFLFFGMGIIYLYISLPKKSFRRYLYGDVVARWLTQ